MTRPATVTVCPKFDPAGRPDRPGKFCVECGCTKLIHDLMNRERPAPSVPDLKLVKESDDAV